VVTGSGLGLIFKEEVALRCVALFHLSNATQRPQDNVGVLPPRKFEAGCAALGVVLSAKEHEWVGRAAAAGDGSAGVDYRAFCDAFRD